MLSILIQYFMHRFADSIHIGKRPQSPNTAYYLNPTHIYLLHAYLCTSSTDSRFVNPHSSEP